ncbi:MAG: peptidylprolyl isomerase [Candidatus Omnitrophota bacterium]
MLKKLRNKKIAKSVFFVLLILILPAFVFWGFGSYVRNKQEVKFRGKIHGRNISEQEFQEALEAVRIQAILQFGDRIAEVGRYLDLRSMAAERILLLSEAKKRRIRVNDKEVVEAIRDYPVFQINGRFNDKYYQETLQYVFHTQPRVFEEYIRQNLMLAKLYRGITDNTELNDGEILKEYRKANEKLSLYYIASRVTDFTREVNPDEKGLKTYFRENHLSFKRPLSFNLEYFVLGKDDEGSSNIQEKIRKILPQLKSGKDINKIARGFNGEVKETGLFVIPGPIPGLGWSQRLTALISKAKAGQYLPPAEIDKSYYLMRVKERKETYIPEFEEIKERVRLAYIKDMAYKSARAGIEECLDKLKESAKEKIGLAEFEKAAKASGLKVSATEPFTYGSYIQGVGSSDIFWSRAQDLKEGGSSGIIENPAGFYIIRLKSKTPIDESKFEAEKKDFSQKLLVQKKQERFAAFVKELKKIHQLE